MELYTTVQAEFFCQSVSKIFDNRCILKIFVLLHKIKFWVLVFDILGKKNIESDSCLNCMVSVNFCNFFKKSLKIFDVFLL